MNDQDLTYLVGFKQSATKTIQQNDHYQELTHAAQIKGGFFNACDSEAINRQLNVKAQLHRAKTMTSAKQGREALSEAKKQLGLSNGAKVRHGSMAERFQNQSRRSIPTGGNVVELSRDGLHAVADAPLSYIQPQQMQSGWVMNPDQKKSNRHRLEYVPQNGASLYLMRREWSQQTKLQLVFRPSPSDAPDVNTGDRYTEQLTTRAVKKIFESGAYVAACHGGFTTFLTLTFDEAQRAKILGESGEDKITIGSEISRFLDGAKKVYERGFEYTAGESNGLQGEIEAAQDIVKVEGIEGDFHYIWVAECPANEDGEPNPHVHMLLNWQVEPAHFQAWSKRLEKIWGHGFAHLERIKFKEAASGYLIKAIGYAAKGNNANQGIIRGNRYNIARCSRAPAWEVLASFDVDNMTSIIKECGYKLEQWRKPMARELRRKQTKKDQAIKAMAVNKDNQQTQYRLKNLIAKLDSEMRDCRQAMKSRGVYADTKNTFAITFEGEEANTKADTFMEWAAGARGWSMNSDEFDLSDLREHVQAQYQSEFDHWQYKQAYWRGLLADAANMNWKSEEEIEALKSLHWSYYEDDTRLYA